MTCVDCGIEFDSTGQVCAMGASLSRMGGVWVTVEQWIRCPECTRLNGLGLLDSERDDPEA